LEKGRAEMALPLSYPMASSKFLSTGNDQIPSAMVFCGFVVNCTVGLNCETWPKSFHKLAGEKDFVTLIS
jgi:hypothetical protein